MSATADQVERLMDAIEHLKADRRGDARGVLRELIAENSDFEDAWLWMSLAVDSLDQSAVCLDNALRVNPANDRAAAALLRLRAGDLILAVQRGRYKLFRDLALTSMWLLVVISLCAALATFGALY
ncbi:MAG: hypothetical protein IPK52_16650 [Chloroflexi bacterium]|nr:hypothetical protein [Chloroflexota bacterium]